MSKVSDKVPGIEIIGIGSRRIYRTTEDGTVPITTKKGEEHKAPFLGSYERGSIFVADDNGNVVSSIIGLEGAEWLARRVLIGDKRTLTHPSTCIDLAAVVMLLFTENTPPTDKLVEQAKRAET